MGKQLPALTASHIKFIEQQALFFVATAAPHGRVNVSPKGLDTLRVIGPDSITWLNLTGSGNETAAHLLQEPRITLMWCAFKGTPMILRVYGTARTYRAGTEFWEAHIDHFPTYAGSRQLVSVKVELVQTSCGMGVPLLEYQGERELLEPWAASRGESGMHAYRQEKNTKSLDGFPTDITPEK
jgi:hypothetical protein